MQQYDTIIINIDMLETMWLKGGKLFPYILGLSQTAFILEWLSQNIKPGIQDLLAANKSITRKWPNLVPPHVGRMVWNNLRNI